MSGVDTLLRYGLEVAATRWLRCRDNEGRILAAFLIRPAGEIISAEALDVILRPSNGRWADLRKHEIDTYWGRNRGRVSVCRLRSALRDVGFPDAIENLSGLGYRMQADPREGIRLAIEATL